MTQDAVAVGTRVALRAPRPADLPAWSALIANNREHLAGWIALPPEDEDPGAQALFHATLEASRTDGFEKMFVVDRTTAALLGVLNLNMIVRGSFWSAYVGYWIDRAHAGRGLMREALSLGLGHAFEGLGLHRVEANLRPENEASRALVARLGFVKEGYSQRYLKIDGQWRDHERWAITVERWRGEA